MPAQIKAFFAITLIVLFYWAWSCVSGLRFGLSAATAMADKDVLIKLWAAFDAAPTVFWCLLVLVFAWLIAFRHRGWARIAFVIVVLLHQIQPFLLMWAAHNRALLPSLQGRIVDLGLSLLLAVAAWLVFSGGARGWFRQGMA